MANKLGVNCVSTIIVRKLYAKHGKEKTLEILEKAFILSKDRKLKKEYLLFIIEIYNHKEKVD